MKETVSLLNEPDSMIDIENMSDGDFISLIKTFMGTDVANLDQEQVNDQLQRILIETSNRNINYISIFFESLPETTSGDQIRSGTSVAAKLYRALFHFSTTQEYQNNDQYYSVARELENIIDQNPQMIGPVALWQIAQDMLWRRDVPQATKRSLIGSMTYAIAFFDRTDYEVELLKHLDLDNPQNYSKTSHLLEAIKYFWENAGQLWAAQNGAKKFYEDILDKVDTTPETNFILFVRLKEISSLFKRSDEFIFESHDQIPFELSKGIYAYRNPDGSLFIVPEDANGQVESLTRLFHSNRKQIQPPQHLIDEARANGENTVSWTPPQRLMRERLALIREMSQLADIPLANRISEVAPHSREKLQELLFDYEYLVSRPIRTIIQKEFGFKLSELTIEEQFYCLNYLKKVKVSQLDQVKNFISLHGITGLRTFLSLEKGSDSLGDKIIAFGQHDEVAAKVFLYYSDLLDSANQAEVLVRGLSNCTGDTCLELANQVKENILNRAQKDLERALTMDDMQHAEDLVKTYIAKAKEYVALLQELKMKKIESVSATNVTEQDKNQMRRILSSNYTKNYPKEEDADFRNAVEESLERAFSNPNTTINMIRDEDNIVCFNRFDTIQDASGKQFFYFGSVNAHPAYSGVGSIMIEESIQKQLEQNMPIMAHCDPTQAITKKYIEDGFIATDFKTIFNKPSFEIWRLSDMSEYFMSKKMSQEELISYRGNSLIVRKINDNEHYPELSEERALTRYFTYQEQTYVIFERIPPHIKKNLTYTV